MNIIAVDDEYQVLDSLVEAIQTVRPDADIEGFTSPNEALEHARGKRVDVAFLDIRMGEMNGLSLARHLKDIYGQTNIVFVTAYADYTGDAIAMRASGYVLKPVNPRHVREEINNLRYPVRLPDKGLCVQCFGDFEVFMDGRPLEFSRTKTKELFAYLISRNGALCTNNEIIAVIWEGKTDSGSLQGHFRHLVTDLRRTLDAAGAGGAVLKKRGALAVRPDKLYCDYYEMLKGSVSAFNSYRGEYMAQYSWAELTNAHLWHRQ